LLLIKNECLFVIGKLESGLKAGKWFESWKEDWRERDKRGELYLLKFLFDFFGLTRVHPGQPIWPVIRSWDRVNHRVGFQNYGINYK
jgi:hypothetical protein